jgi:hypothetical protein
MTPPADQQQNNDPTRQTSHRDTQHSTATTTPSSTQQRPTLQNLRSHPCITIRWAAEGGQNRHEELILKTGFVELGWGG